MLWESSGRGSRRASWQVREDAVFRPCQGALGEGARDNPYKRRPKRLRYIGLVTLTVLALVVVVLALMG